LKYSDVWLIKNTSIAHNGDGTSRVTVTLEYVTDFTDVATQVDASDSGV
jgi:hypothetical protein